MIPNRDKQIVLKHKKRRILYVLMSELMEVGKEVRDFSSKDLANTIGDDSMFPYDRVKDYLHDMEKMGIISRRVEYGSKSNGMSAGRHFHLTILLAPDEAEAAFDIADKEELRKYHVAISEGNRRSAKRRWEKATAKKINTDKTAIRYEQDEPVEAIAGPEAPSPFEVLKPMRKDEPKALVEAARQYRDKTGGIRSKIDDVIATAKELGISINETALRESVTVENDERLEIICLVLPYIEALERRVEALLEKSTDLNVPFFDKTKGGVASKTAN